MDKTNLLVASADILPLMREFERTSTAVTNAYAMNPGYYFARDGQMGSMAALTGAAHSPDEPVTGITWLDAVAFCNALSRLEGRQPCYYTDPEFKNVFRNMHQATWYQGRINPKEIKKPEPVIYVKWDADGHRLPTPAEWKLAAGSPAPVKASGDSTKPVGSGEANARGFYDMYGNVWELVWTYGDAYDPKKDLEIVALGGSFHGAEKPESFSASPYGDVPFDGHHAVGFRIVSRDPGLARPAQGDTKGVPAWVIQRTNRRFMRHPKQRNWRRNRSSLRPRSPRSPRCR